MEKQKRWQFFLICAVVVLTIYNILPTLFYYAKPLHKSVDEKKANEISVAIGQRVNSLENDSLSWLRSYCSLLRLKPQTIAFDEKQPEFVTLTFKNSTEAGLFRQHLTRAGALISFAPAQLGLYNDDPANKSVTVQRRIPLHFDAKQASQFFQFSTKTDAQGKITDLYRALVNDRALEVGISLGGASENAEYVRGAAGSVRDPQVQELILQLSQNILSFVKTFGEKGPIAARYFASFTQSETGNHAKSIQDLLLAMQQMKDQLRLEKVALQGQAADGVKKLRLQQLSSFEETLTSAEAIVKRQTHAMSAGATPWNYNSFGAVLQESALKQASNLQVISLQNRNPFIEQIVIDWANEKIYLRPYADILALKTSLEKNKEKSYLSDQVDQFIFNQIATTSRQTRETISPTEGQFEIALNQLPNSKSFLAMRLGSVAQAEATQVQTALSANWLPKHQDLSRKAFPVLDYNTYQSLPLDQQKLGLVIYAPSQYNKMPPKGFRMNSLYVIAKGLDKILERVRQNPESEEAKQFLFDFYALRDLLQKNGFFGYAGSSYALGPEYASDFIFEKEDYFQTILKATREDFTVHGTKRFAVLEFTDVEQRLLTENKIDTRIHEDLLKWRDDYNAAELDIKGVSRYDVPKPTKSPLWSNFCLSFVKYFRGDERKILHWGLDLSGGKTVQIELRDRNNRVVTAEEDLKQGVNELYKRVNKMGVSEVSIRQEGNTITLDFPGSQGLSAAELVKASSMYFHIVNEQFSLNNPALAENVNRFLQDVWNEAVVTNRKDAEQIQMIAWKHIHGDSFDPEVVKPRSDAAKALHDNGLKLASPLDPSSSSAFDDSLSRLAIIRGDDFTDWQGQTHPLMIVFRNFALEGSNLNDVHASYDPSKGNFLGFSVKSGQARDELYAWTSQFAKEKITGTPKENFSKGRGWRMAVILNGSIISSPTLDSALKDSAMITGSFTQREVNQLEADLKAGSLSFTPHILSEKNVSPELGAHERSLGIWAMAIALALVIGVMIAYYRFGGLVASVAVIFNLLIMWATLQNLQATLTLASIAGLILTVAMAVDANVLVFERIREEFQLSGRIAQAVHAGYRKAFSAIIDSNTTTIIAALILLHFDSGPIKGFAVTLIIGIVSSMFTALFLTRYFFAGWVQNPEHKALKMSNWIKSSQFNFLKFSKPTLIFSTLVILVGGYFFLSQRHTILGMDFTGGYAVSFELTPKQGSDYRKAVETALVQAGATAQDFQIRELTPANNIRLFLSRSMQESGRPFFGMPLETETKELGYLYENNPRIVWIVQALSKAGLTPTPASLETLNTNWAEVSGQMSDSMRNSAIIGLMIALLCILIYITARFEFKYAISATICLAHDVIFTIAVLAALHAFGVPIQIDLNTVAALMTIVGYSLNDTIIIFDRIREDLRLIHKASFKEVINHALNVTLSRTMMTSGITLLVLIPLVALGGSTLFGFALVMGVGVVFGTLSSLFIAAPLLEYFHKREERKETELLTHQE